ncbi:hypothetical protein ELK54_23520 [Klebsiella pneumoniae]|nr:hypothetical protein [Klebsiella pneumoniae]MBZ7297164.1 hypothetical protein [Klebsiella variicola]MRE87100.1 hypothetical protein [Klebsiella quasipneumoniae]MBL2624144.1 hypothetical protein [Klebsiella pneumoniae]MBL2651393.1 hypothetical protein [Klebsiella pneumoniae]
MLVFLWRVTNLSVGNAQNEISNGLPYDGLLLKRRCRGRRLCFTRALPLVWTFNRDNRVTISVSHSQQRLICVTRQLNERLRKTPDYESSAERSNKYITSIN